MFRIKLFIFILILFSVSELAKAQLQIPEGRRLREIIEDKYKNGNLIIGGTTGSWAFNTNTGKIMDREFSYVTPENDFKQPQIHPDNSGTWSWSRADAWKSHIKQNNQVLRIHGPISPQCSNWAKSDVRTAVELEKNMRDFFEALCKRYNGVEGIFSLDVVNEVVINGQWHKNKPGTNWEVPWYIIGQDTDKNKTPLYIKYAFEIANEHAPDLKLVFNHHEQTIVNSSWSRIKETIGYLREMGLRVDAIGWQSHINAGWELIEGQQQALSDLIDWAHENDLEFHITEQSVYLTGNSKEDYKKQAATFKAIIDILVEKSAKGKVCWNTWHIDDANGWRGDEYPSLFDKNYRAKPSYYAVQLALEAKGDYTTGHKVQFKVKNKITNADIEDCKLTIDGKSVQTDDKGIAAMDLTAGMYNLKAEKRFIKTLEAVNLSVYSDTTFTIFVDTTAVKYDVTFNVQEKTTGNAVISLHINIDSTNNKTDFNGISIVAVSPGEHLAVFSKDYYKPSEYTYVINSDTTIYVDVEKSHANIKIYTKNGSQPVNDVLVKLGKDSLLTTTLGLCKFNHVPVDSIFYYEITKDGYLSHKGYISTKRDTAITFQMFTTGIEDMEKNTYLNIYPNPVAKIVQIDSNLKLHSANIYSMDGNRIKHFDIENKNAFDVSELKNGIYILYLELVDYAPGFARKLIIRK